MVMTTGIQMMGVYTAATTTNALFDVLLAMLPNVDLTTGTGVTSIRADGGTGAGQGIPGFLDEASPTMIAQLRVELLAMRAEAGNVAI